MIDESVPIAELGVSADSLKVKPNPFKERAVGLLKRIPFPIHRNGFSSEQASFAQAPKLVEANPPEAVELKPLPAAQPTEISKVIPEKTEGVAEAAISAPQTATPPELSREDRLSARFDEITSAKPTPVDELTKLNEEGPEDLEFASPKQETAEQIKERVEFLNNELFPSLGISQNDEQLWLKENTGEFAEVGKRSFENIRTTVTRFATWAERVNGLSSLQIREKVETEVARIKGQTFLTLNISPEATLQAKEQGSIKNVLDFSPEERVSIAHNVGDITGYIQRRDELNNALHYEGLPESSTISAALASPNGRAEKVGAARQYGDVFIVLNDEVAQRAVYIIGDSMNSALGNLGGWINNDIAAEDVRDSALSRQVIRPHAELASGLMNLLYDLGNLSGANSRYIETLIYGGLTPSDFKSVNLPSDAVGPPQSELAKNFSAVSDKLKAAYGDKYSIV